MPTKKTGYFLTIAGAIAFLASVLMDVVSGGDIAIGASQILGMIVGVTITLLGLFLVFVYPHSDIHIRSGIQAGLKGLLDLPVSAWVVAGFVVAYAAFFLFPVFYNAEHTMWYFNRYIPNANPIGVDVRDTLRYLEDWLVSGESPYKDNLTAYSPLTMLLYSPLLLIPYPTYYYVMTVLTLLLHAGSALVVALFVRRRHDVSMPLLVFGFSIFSYGMQFELERGQFNLIAFALCLIAIYIFHAHYEYRYVAYLLFTLSVQLKIYPLILIVMFIKDWRDWKGNLKRFAGIALLNFALLFVLGFRLLGDFLRAVANKQALAGSWNGNHSLKGFVNYLVVDGFGLFSPETLTALQQFQAWIETLFLVIIALCFLSILIRAYIQNSSEPNPNLLLAGTICAMIVPSISQDYKLPILTAPIAALFCSLSLPEHKWKRILTIFLILLMSMAYWSTQYPFRVKPDFLIRNFPALFILLVAASVLNFLAPPKPGAVAAEDPKV